MWKPPATEQGDLWRGLERGCLAYLDVCLDPAIRRIIIQDARSALTPEEMTKIASFGPGLLSDAIKEAIDAGVIDPTSPEILSYILGGALDGAALYIGSSEHPEKTRAQAGAMLSKLLESFRRGRTLVRDRGNIRASPPHRTEFDRRRRCVPNFAYRFTISPSIDHAIERDRLE